MAEKIKVGIVSYLNTRPLIYGLRQEPMASQIELWEDTPARLADMLVNGEIDLGLVPVATIPHLPTYQVVGNYCIGTEGEVASVCLFSEVPLEQIETVYLDYQSRSSVALLKWIMQEYWGIKPRLIDAENEDFRAEIKGTSAGLVIGDRAFEQRKISTFIYDLGSEWKKITGLPFVFAAWVSVKPLPEAFIRDFNQANAVGLNALDDILKDIHYDLYDLRKYYTIHVSYPLNEAKRRGMEKFLQVIGG
ncbi:MAG: menaquinone biosynthesis protein [Chitinophagaceae bacterium]|nr:menaquinone biosynthesis protein [Chitinophagaceae bacterium]